jgi:hypothetical protein
MFKSSPAQACANVTGAFAESVGAQRSFDKLTQGKKR